MSVQGYNTLIHKTVAGQHTLEGSTVLATIVQEAIDIPIEAIVIPTETTSSK